MHNFQFANGTESFYVTYSDFPFSTTAEQLLSDVRNGQVGTGRVFSDGAIPVSGRPYYTSFSRKTTGCMSAASSSTIYASTT